MIVMLLFSGFFVLMNVVLLTLTVGNVSLPEPMAELLYDMGYSLGQLGQGLGLTTGIIDFVAATSATFFAIAGVALAAKLIGHPVKFIAVAIASVISATLL